MKAKTILIALALVSTTMLKAQHTISVSIKKLESSQGLVMIELVDKNDQVVQQLAEPISSNACTVTFEDVESGTYAIRYYHDENGNRKMDTGNFGIPKEGYGFSNNARGFMGPPDFEDMLFEVSQDVKMSLKTVN